MNQQDILRMERLWALREMSKAQCKELLCCAVEAKCTMQDGSESRLLSIVRTVREASHTGFGYAGSDGPKLHIHTSILRARDSKAVSNCRINDEAGSCEHKNEVSEMFVVFLICWPSLSGLAIRRHRSRVVRIEMGGGTTTVSDVNNLESSTPLP